MKKLATIFIALLVAMVSMFGGLIGCNREEVEKVDSEKTQLYVGVYNAGFGTEYVKDLKERFEAEYEGVSFEKDKMGVQIVMRDVEQGGVFLGQIGSRDIPEVFFTSNADYYQFYDRGYILNIDDVVTENPTAYGDNGTIESKMTEEAKKFFETDEGYFAVPYVTSYEGIVMNVKIWEDEGLYFAKGGAPSEFCTFTQTNNDNPATLPEGVTKWNDDLYEFTGTGEKSAGPDGKYGTSDDGQPATYEEFLIFCDNCYANGVQAFHWAGRWPQTISKVGISMVADFEGIDQMKLNYTYEGMATSLVDVDSNGNVTPLPAQKIDNSNGYLLAKQEGKYQVLKFWEELLHSNNYFNPTVSLDTKNHETSDAIADFVTGGILSGKTKIATLLDGTWFWNECQLSVDVVEQATDGQLNKDNMKFQMMAFPKATMQKVGEPMTMCIDGTSICAINSRTPSWKVDLAKKFVRFAFTNESNIKFTEITSCLRDFDYTEPSNYLQNNYFAKNLYEMNKSANRMLTASDNPMYIYNAVNFYNSEIFWSSEINGTLYNVPCTAMVKENVSAESYFNGMQNYRNKEDWDTLYSDYYYYNALNNN